MMQTETHNENICKTREKANQFQSETWTKNYIKIIDEMLTLILVAMMKTRAKIYAEISKTTDLDKIASIYKTSLIISE
nr:hypothetical protein [Mycoplasmopsis agalactiae]